MNTLLPLLLACAKNTDPEPATEPAAEAAGEVELRLSPSELVYDEAAGTATYSPGSSVRSARYTHYVIDLASLESVLGGRPQAPVSVVVSVDEGTTELVTPEDPMAASPKGGFQITTYSAVVLRRAR